MIVAEHFVPIDFDPKALPDFGGVYCICRWSIPLYIGRTWRFSQRLYKHNQLAPANWIGATHIKLTQTSDDQNNSHGFTAKLEREWIAKYKPVLNGGTRGKRG